MKILTYNTYNNTLCVTGSFCYLCRSLQKSFPSLDLFIHTTYSLPIIVVNLMPVPPSFSAKHRPNKTMEARSEQIKIKGDCKTASKKGCPIPPMSAYDIFIHLERKACSKNEWGSSSDMFQTDAHFASNVSSKWQNIDATLKMELEELAKLEQERYNREMEEWEMSTEAQEPETAKMASGQISHCEKPPAKKRKSLSKTCHSGIAFPTLPFEAAPGYRRIIRHNAQSSLLQGSAFLQG